MPKIIVDKVKCIGCGLCVSLAEKTFKMNDQGKSEVLPNPSDPEEKIKEAAEACPVEAIIINE